MATFVHITPQTSVPAIRRSGIAAFRLKPDSEPSRGVFCFPVLPDFFASHQWMRELRRWGNQTRIGVYFRIPDTQLVHAGHYGGTHVQMTAAEAVAHTVPLGWEVVIPRAVNRREIIRVKALPQITGWRIHPDAKGAPPTWLTQGSYGARKVRMAMEEKERRERERYYSRFPAEWYAED